jgi:hypothetical protein
MAPHCGRDPPTVATRGRRSRPTNGLSKGGSEPLAADRDEAVVRRVLQVQQAPESRGRGGTARFNLADELLGVVVILRP